MEFKYSFLVIAFCFLLSSCKTYKATNFTLPEPENTYDKPIKYQDKKTYQAFDVYADNEFDAARLNDFRGVLDTHFVATFSPENTPINASTYYSFRVWSSIKKRISIDLTYTEHGHRYWPKLSHDRKNWLPIDTANYEVMDSGKYARIYVDIGPKKLFISGQEIINSTDVRSWSDSIAQANNIHIEKIGQSKEGRELYYLDLCEDERKDKDAIVILSRQHPPEVTGQMAMHAFVEEFLSSRKLSKDFIKKHRILIYPMLNPDGVDLGHWRHNAGGIDQNRDWAYYRQEEINVVANHIVKTTKKYKNQVLVGLDFHSTQKDIYYTLTDNLKSCVHGVKDYWLEGIDDAFPDYTPNDGAYDLNQPISKAWFYLQFGAEGITYEVGDETPRDFVKNKAKVAARELMKLLVLR